MKTAKTLFLSLSVTFSALGALFTLLAFFDSEVTDKTPWIFVEVGFVATFAIFLYFTRLYMKGHRVKYAWNAKEYKKQLAEVLPHFTSFSGEERKKLLEDCKNSFRTTGTVLKWNDFLFDNVFREKEKVTVLSLIVTDLLSGVDRGDGFEGMIGASDRGEYQYSRTFVDGSREDALDGWEIFSLLSCPLFSYGFRYLSKCVFQRCDFTFCDTGVSSEYSEKVNKSRDMVATVYSPSLRTFRDELETAAQKLSAYHKSNSDN